LPSPDEALAYEFSPEEEIAIAAFRRVQIVGTPDVVRQRIEERAAATEADEVMIASHTYDPAARLHSYELVARAMA
jgi:alkanesulfonate monooxygenase SsuD/methylene tetrahydromethanopterin reductase-like flavin-dependent oxidoreductase (luciferase family)